MRKLSLQGPGRLACLLDSSAPLTPIRADRMIGRKAALPPLFHWVLFLFSSLCSPPFCLALLLKKQRTPRLQLLWTGCCSKVFSGGFVLFHGRLLSLLLSLYRSLYLSPILVVSCSASRQSTSAVCFPRVSVDISVFVSIISLAASAARLSWSTSPPNPLRASGFFVFRFSHLLSASAYHRVRIFPFVD